MLYAAQFGSSACAHLLLFLGLASKLTKAFDCGIDPLQLGIKNTPLDNGVPVNRGVQFKLPGNQILGLRLSTAWNNTFISNANNCRRGNNSYDNACQGAVGSTFDPVENEGWEPYLTSDWADIVAHVDDPPAGANVVRGVAATDLDDGPVIELPIAVWSNPSIDPVKGSSSPPSRSVFGIGPSSDFIRSLLNGSFVPSGFMGLYFGSRSLNCSEDGEMTIGGWDASRVDGSFVNYSMNSMPMNATCPLRVRVTGITLQNDVGSHPLITDGEAVSACVDPFQNAIGLTDALFAIWSNLTEHPTAENDPTFTEQTYPLANERLMDTLTIELEGGYATTISHCELVSLERGADLQGVGEYTVTNSSRIMASVSSGRSDLGTNFGVLLGGVFLSSTYLTIDYENNQFGLAPVRTRAGSSQAPSVNRVCSKDTSIPPVGNATLPTSSNHTGLADKKDDSGGGLSTDAKATIGGSVAGGVIAIAGVIIAFLAYKHAKSAEKARRQSEAEKMDIERARTESTYIGMSPMSRPGEFASPNIGLGVGLETQERKHSEGVELPKAALGESC